MSTQRLVWALLTVVAAWGFVPASAEARARRLHVQTVCFSVRNGSDALASDVYGLRYTVGRPRPATPAIVLVHGVASSTANWDFTRRASVARRLASAGYVVISYDRLGFAKSRYRGAGGGRAITTPNQRDMLHQVVQEVKHGTYRIVAGSSCAAAGPRSGLHSHRVAIIGHSAGGAIVEGYPGKYHDVAAMVQADWANQPPLTGVVPPTSPEVVSVSAQIAQGKDYVAFFDGRQQCEQFNLYPAGAIPRLVQIACNPAKFVLTPAGEFIGFAQLTRENDTYVPLTGSTPVLLTWGDHDSIAPPETAAADYKYWVDHCRGCDVTAYTLPRTGHLFMVHRSLSDWLREVTGWLASRGLRAR